MLEIKAKIFVFVEKNFFKNFSNRDLFQIVQ